MKENFWYWDLGRYFPIFSVFINSDKRCSTCFYFKYCYQGGFSDADFDFWRSLPFNSCVVFWISKSNPSFRGEEFIENESLLGEDLISPDWYLVGRVDQFMNFRSTSAEKIIANFLLAQKNHLRISRRFLGVILPTTSFYSPKSRKTPSWIFKSKRRRNCEIVRNSVRKLF